MFEARTFKRGFLVVEAFQLGFAAIDFLLQRVDLFLQLAHLAFGSLQLLLDRGFLLLDLLEQLLELGHVLACRFDLFAGVGALVRCG